MMKKYIVRLTDEERAQLKELTNKGKGPAYRIKHANILLNVDIDGSDLSDSMVSALLHCHQKTVGNVRKRFVEQGLEAALNRKKQINPSRQRKLDGEGEARLIAIACSEPPEGRAEWTLQMLADELIALKAVDSICDQTVRRTLKKTNLNLT
ncbi:MAG: helix-turn-helix domain-containing protein [Cytophagales bacterium]|nr:helix-turn-helix domain-containing protein [Cytophagales bacterium]